MQKITPFLWFDTQAEEAAEFYVSIFPNSKILDVSRYGDAGPGPKGSAMTVAFELAGQAYLGLNGGPTFKFSEAVSFVINCQDQAEVDAYWNRLTAEGGAPGQCGWLKDKFGLSWQVVPEALPRLIQDPDPARSQRVMQAMMRMTRIVVADLEAAAAGAQAAPA